MTSSSVKCSRGRTAGLKRWLERLESTGLNDGFEGLVLGAAMYTENALMTIMTSD